ncbi:MAG: glycosyltransferase [Candidatus Pacearchaeota archaeon]|nr:glycosyltransferase [Candidatus Pacearchaeota archaeon]
MKIAIFHTSMDNIGGSEIVTLILARELKADIYTTNIDMEKIKKMGFDDVKLVSIGKISFNNDHFRKQIISWFFKRLNLKDKYDFFIISGEWAVSAAMNNRPNLYYMHTPIRELWDMYKEIRKKIMPSRRLLFDIWVLYNRFLNKKYIKHVEKIICNSENTRQRLKTFLHHDAKVVNPPIYTDKFHYEKNGNYWLSVNRLVKDKQVEIQIEAFKKLSKEKLIIVGCFEETKYLNTYIRYLQKIKPNNVEILHWVDFDKLTKLYANCKGFIATANDEDFGMSVVEAMASGKPVIAGNEGGYKETVIDGKTGILIDNIDSNKLAEAIKKIGKNPEKFKKECLKRAKKFDTSEFIKKIKQEIKNGK